MTTKLPWSRQTTVPITKSRSVTAVPNARSSTSTGSKRNSYVVNQASMRIKLLEPKKQNTGSSTSSNRRPNSNKNNKNKSPGGSARTSSHADNQNVTLQSTKRVISVYPRTDISALNKFSGENRRVITRNISGNGGIELGNGDTRWLWLIMMKVWPVRHYLQWHGFMARGIAQYLVTKYKYPADAIGVAETLVQSKAFKQLVEHDMDDINFVKLISRIRFDRFSVIAIMYGIDLDQLFKFIDTASSKNKTPFVSPWVHILDLTGTFRAEKYNFNSFLSDRYMDCVNDMTRFLNCSLVSYPPKPENGPRMKWTIWKGMIERVFSVKANTTSPQNNPKMDNRAKSSLAERALIAYAEYLAQTHILLPKNIKEQMKNTVPRWNENLKSTSALQWVIMDIIRAIKTPAIYACSLLSEGISTTRVADILNANLKRFTERNIRRLNDIVSTYHTQGLLFVAHHLLKKTRGFTKKPLFDLLSDKKVQIFEQMPYKKPKFVERDLADIFNIPHPTSTVQRIRTHIKNKMLMSRRVLAGKFSRAGSARTASRARTASLASRANRV